MYVASGISSERGMCPCHCVCGSIPVSDFPLRPILVSSVCKVDILCHCWSSPVSDVASHCILDELEAHLTGAWQQPEQSVNAVNGFANLPA